MIGLQETELENIRTKVMTLSEEKDSQAVKTLVYLTDDEYRAFNAMRKFDYQTKLMNKFEKMIKPDVMPSADEENYLHDVRDMLESNLDVIN